MAAPRKKVKIKLRHHLRNHFIPHEGNDYVPHLLKHRALLIYSGILVATKAALVIVGIAFPSASLYSFAINESSIVSLTNEARIGARIAEVSVNPKLRGAAQAKADDMILRQYFSHEGPEGESPWYWLNKSGYRYSTAGENLAIHYTTAEALEQGWLASPSHRANILDKRFTEVGIGFAKGKIEGYDSMVVVQLFAAPRSSAVAAAATTTPAVVADQPERVMDTKVVLKDDVLNIQVKAPEATSVSGHVGEENIAFTKTQTSGTWVGKVDPKDSGRETQEVYATVNVPNAQPETKLVALVVANGQVGDLYRTEPKQEVKVMGVSIDGLGDKTRTFYLATLIVLISILLMSIFIKFHIQRPSIIAHTVAVMGLAILFTIV